MCKVFLFPISISIRLRCVGESFFLLPCSTSLYETKLLENLCYSLCTFSRTRKSSPALFAPSLCPAGVDGARGNSLAKQLESDEEKVSRCRNIFLNRKRTEVCSLRSTFTAQLLAERVKRRFFQWLSRIAFVCSLLFMWRPEARYIRNAYLFRHRRFHVQTELIRLWLIALTRWHLVD